MLKVVLSICGDTDSLKQALTKAEFYFLFVFVQNIDEVQFWILISGFGPSHKKLITCLLCHSYLDISSYLREALETHIQLITNRPFIEVSIVNILKNFELQIYYKLLLFLTQKKNLIL